MHPDELEPVLLQLKALGLAVNTEHTDTDRWVLACDQRQADLAPLIDALLLDRNQPSLLQQPRLVKAVADSLQGSNVKLCSLFDPPEPDVTEPAQPGERPGIGHLPEG